ncbi:MAG: ArsA family ATPase [Pseudomonadota bacterium]
MRVILFAGKGGVGKTSMAGATGTACARAGKKTLILSLDTAHSLSDVFDRKAKLLDVNQGQPVAVADNLWIQELDVQRELFAELAGLAGHEVPPPDQDKSFFKKILG